MSFGRLPPGSRRDVDWAAGGLCCRGSRLSRDDPAVRVVTRGMGRRCVSAFGSDWEAGVAARTILDHYDRVSRILDSAPTKVVVFQCPCGTGARQRYPRGARPQRRAILVEAPVSSTKTSFSGSRSSWVSSQDHRRRSTSGRCCSLAGVVFLNVMPRRSKKRHTVLWDIRAIAAVMPGMNHGETRLRRRDAGWATAAALGEPGSRSARRPSWRGCPARSRSPSTRWYSAFRRGPAGGGLRITGRCGGRRAGCAAMHGPQFQEPLFESSSRAYMEAAGMAVQAPRTGRRRRLPAPSLPRPGEDAVEISKARFVLLYITRVRWERGHFFILEPEQCERLVPRL